MPLHVYNFNTTYDPPFFFPKLFYPPPLEALEVYDISTPRPAIFYFPKPPANIKPKLSIQMPTQ